MNITTFKIPDTFTQNGRLNMAKGSDAIDVCLGLMVKTQKEELLGDPNFGTNLESYRYNQNVNVLNDQIADDILNACNAYDSRITLNSTDVNVSVKDENTLNINISYYLKNEDSTFNTIITSGVNK